MKFSQGNLDYRIDVNSQNEIGELSQSFNLMADNLQVELSERKQAQEELKKTPRSPRRVSERTYCQNWREQTGKMEQEICERKQAEEALRESEEKLARAEKMKALGTIGRWCLPTT